MEIKGSNPQKYSAGFHYNQLIFELKKVHYWGEILGDFFFIYKFSHWSCLYVIDIKYCYMGCIYVQFKIVHDKLELGALEYVKHS